MRSAIPVSGKRRNAPPGLIFPHHLQRWAKAAIFCPPAAFRAVCGTKHHGTARALPVDEIFAVLWVFNYEIWYNGEN